MRQRDRRRVSALLGALGCLLVLGACQHWSFPEDESPRALEVAPSPSSDDEVSRAVGRNASTITLAFAGDVHFEGGLKGLLDRRGSTLGPMSPALREADLAMVNLESALTRRGKPAPKELENPDERYWFRSPPSVLGLLDRSGVDVVSMANNHGADYGPIGLRDTLRAAEDSQVAVVGVGRDPAEAFRPHRVDIDGTTVAVLAADSSPRESTDPTWAVERGRGPGIAAARTPDAPRLLAAVREAASTDDVVVVYLHWGEENQVRATRLQRSLATALAKAGADVVVGSHAHQLQGAGLVGATFVSYGLGNFLWYHGRQSATGVLQIRVSGGQVSGATLAPARIPPQGGQPLPLTGAARTEAVAAWRRLRATTDLDAAGIGARRMGDSPSAVPSDRDRTRDDGNRSSTPAPYEADVRGIGPALRQRMLANSHRPGCPVPLADLRHLRLTFVDFEGRVRKGSMVVHKDVAGDVVGVFRAIYRARFPLKAMRLIDAYGGDDNRSMAANNTSGYNCRRVDGSDNLSDHAYGRAIDINPVQNPYVTDGRTLPQAGRDFVAVARDAGAAAPRGVIKQDDAVTRAFDRVGWTWGGLWNDPDFQHFSAP